MFCKRGLFSSWITVQQWIIAAASGSPSVMQSLFSTIFVMAPKPNPTRSLYLLLNNSIRSCCYQVSRGNLGLVTRQPGFSQQVCVFTDLAAIIIKVCVCLSGWSAASHRVLVLQPESGLFWLTETNNTTTNVPGFHLSWGQTRKCCLFKSFRSITKCSVVLFSRPYPFS